jgi:hypothetical protein
MAYIGLPPSNSFVSLKRQVITGDGTASYTLDHSVASVNDVAIFVNNVRQDPAGYSISGTSLTLGGTIESSDDCYVIFLGQALQTVTPDSNTITAAMLQSSSVTPAKLNLDSGITVTTSDNSDNLTLTSTDADANAGPNLRLYRNSSSPADSDLIGNIQFEGRNDNSEDVVYAEISGRANDVSDGTEDGLIFIKAMTGGTLTEYMRFDPGSAGIVVNDNSGDIDFRVESDNETHMLFVDAGNDAVGIGNSDLSPASSSTATHAAFKNGGSKLEISASSNPALAVNRVNSEGTAVELRQAGGLRGSISVAGATASFNTSSDYRLKENVDYDFDATTRLKQLKPARFNWISDETNTLVDGFLAHEAQTVVPESVIGEKDAVDENGNVVPQQIDHSKLVPLLVKTIQELEARIKTLEDA